MKTRALVLTVLTSIAFMDVSVRTQQSPAPASPFVANEVVIAFEPWASDATKALARSVVRGGLKRALRGGPDGQLEVASLPDGMPVVAAAAALSRVAGVQYAEPNWIYTHDATSNDPRYTSGELWGMEGDASTPANQYGSQAAEAWAAGFTGHSGVYVAVIDEGINFNHPDLVGNIWTNPFDPVDGIDNDGNGFVDDVHGWDFFQHNNSVFDGGPGSSVDAHGTHVAGTIGATGGNGTGVVGVNWDVTIIPVKFLGPEGGTSADAISAINYVTDLKTRHGLNIVAMNNSWGGGGFSSAMLSAITRAAKANILFVAAAGNNNSNNDLVARYPSNYDTTTGTPTEPAAPYDSVIAVASITSTGARSSFSNYGRSKVDLGAPGSAILSTTPNNTYSVFSGTSMATPHVSGAVTLLASMQPTLTGPEIKQAILGSAVGTPTSSIATLTATGGRLNISLFFSQPPPSPPAAPTGLSASAVSSSQINLSWTDQSTNENGFRIERCTGSGCTSFIEIGSVGVNVTTFQDTTGLAASTTYAYQVVAFNGGGGSSPSNVAEATTLTAPSVPAAPSNLTAAAISSSQINLSWTDNSSNETSFRIERCTGATCTAFSEIAAVGPNVTTYQNTTGLVAGTTYQYRVIAANGTGPSTPSNVAQATTLTAPSVPAAPSNLTAATVSSSQINLSWTDNSSNETSFRIERCTGATCTAFSEIAAVGPNVTTYQNTTGLVAGTTYRYRVIAANGTGPSTPSNIAMATTTGSTGIPAAPTGLVATAGPGVGQITLTWNDNATNEIGFRLYRCGPSGCVDAPAGTVTANTTTFVNSGLLSGASYSYTVHAYNASGYSGASNSASAVAP
jgi:subtilisin family serine protease